MNRPPPEPTRWHAEPEGAAFDTSDWNERLALLYAHWRRIRPAPDLLPGRRHFDPIDVPKALASIWLLDVQREPFRLKYRLVGTNIARIQGGDFTGRWYDEARPNLLKTSPGMERYRLMAETGRATWRRGAPVLAVDPYWKTSENVMLPMANDGRNVDLLMCCSVYYSHDGRVL